MAISPDFSIESEYSGIIVAIDEVGRGPLAGPVMAAAAILDASTIPHGINDSKKLSLKKRDALFDTLMQHCRIEIGVADEKEIEALNILGATKLAMTRAYDKLGVDATIALIDGNQPPKLSCPTRCIVKGDSISLSIAAASIAAKVTRDRLMAELAKTYTGFGWERNAGYGTKEHLSAMQQYGITPHHRKGFAPVRDLLAAGAPAYAVKTDRGMQYGQR
ncbi:MAG: ribonuclease HII [Alphaproteobacteria bacterium]|nr:ribonuclease HII [Alphaproteobacteria bacterium]